MNHRLNELLLERGRLQERIVTQRYVLRQQIVPVSHALGAVDRGIARINAAGQYLRSHPSMAIIAVAALFFMRTRRMMRWAKRGFVVWQSWRVVRERLAMFAARIRHS